MSGDSVNSGKERRLEDIRKESGERACPVQRLLYYMEEFIRGPMCGKCFPCALGTAEARLRLLRLAGRSADIGNADVDALKRIGLQMIEGSFCKKGKDTGRFLIEVLSAHEEDFMRHITGACPQAECHGFVEYSIRAELCDMCGKCREVCNFNAISGERKKPYLSVQVPYEIRQKRCTKCGECIKVCPVGAIEMRSEAVEVPVID